MDNLDVARAAADAQLLLDEALRIRRRATEAHAASVEDARRDAEAVRQRAVLDAGRITADAESVVESWFDEAVEELESLLQRAQHQADELTSEAAERAGLVMALAETARAEAEADRRHAGTIVGTTRAEQERLEAEAAQERSRLLAIALDEADRLRNEGRRALADGLQTAASERDDLIRRASDEIIRRRAQADQELTAEAQRARELAADAAAALVEQARTEAAEILAGADAERLEVLEAAVRDAMTLRAAETEQTAARLRIAERRVGQMLTDAEALAASLVAEAVIEGEAILQRADDAAGTVRAQSRADAVTALAVAEARSAALIEEVRAEAEQIRLVAHSRAASLRHDAMAAAKAFHREAAQALEHLEADLDLLRGPFASLPGTTASVGAPTDTTELTSTDLTNTYPTSTELTNTDLTGAGVATTELTGTDMMGAGRPHREAAGPVEPSASSVPMSVVATSPAGRRDAPIGAPSPTDDMGTSFGATADAPSPARTPLPFVVPDDLRELDGRADAFPGAAVQRITKRRRATAHAGSGQRWLWFWRS